MTGFIFTVLFSVSIFSFYFVTKMESLLWVGSFFLIYVFNKSVFEKRNSEFFTQGNVLISIFLHFAFFILLISRVISYLWGLFWG